MQFEWWPRERPPHPRLRHYPDQVRGRLFSLEGRRESFDKDSLVNERWAKLAALGENGYAVPGVQERRTALQDIIGLHRLKGEPMAFGREFHRLGELASCGALEADPGRSGDFDFGLGMFSRLTRQRARRRAWRGRSSSASLRARSLRVRLSGSPPGHRAAERIRPR